MNTNETLTSALQREAAAHNATAVPVCVICVPGQCIGADCPAFDGWRVSCPHGCNLGSSARAADAAAAGRRIRLHRDATRPLVISAGRPVCDNTLQLPADRAETDPCERGTVGCSVRHTTDSDCQPW